MPLERSAGTVVRHCSQNLLTLTSTSLGSVFCQVLAFAASIYVVDAAPWLIGNVTEP